MTTAFFLCIVLTMMSFGASFISSSPCVRYRATPLFVSASNDIKDDGVLTKDIITISKPVIHWTVPGFKIGWQDDDGKWFDEDGPRNGPPLNYWRQSADQREYDAVMDAVDAVLQESDIESNIHSLERKNSARRPSLSRKMLGQWAPLLLSSRLVTSSSVKPVGDGMMEVPFLLDISRSHGRKFGKRNHYGLWDKTLQNGEDLTISIAGKDATDISVEIVSDEKNEPMDLGSLGQAQVQFGGITYVSDYAMIQRTPEGATDFFLRVDDSYLGVTDEEAEKYN